METFGGILIHENKKAPAEGIAEEKITEFEARYDEIAEQCRKTAEPVFLTKNGEGDLVVMDIGTYNHRKKDVVRVKWYTKMLNLRAIPRLSFFTDNFY